MNAVKANQRPETDGKHKLLILTNINVSNAHLMIAKILKQYSAHTVKFLNVRTPTSFWDNAEWYGFDKEDFDISTYFSGKNLPGKIFMFIKTILKSDVIFCTGEISFFVRLFNKPYIYWCIGADLDQYSKYGCSSFALNNAKERLYRKGIRLIKKFLYRNGIKRASMTVIAPYQFNDICALGYKKLAAFPHTLEGEYLESNLDVRKKNCEELNLIQQVSG